MSPRPTKETQMENLAQAIKDRALEQMADGGPSRISLRAIARKLGITAPAIYNYFQDRGTLIGAMVVDAFTSFGGALERARDACDASDWAERFRALAAAYRKWALDHAQEYRLIFATPHGALPYTYEYGDAPMRSFLVLVEVLNDGLKTGTLRVPSGYVRHTRALERELSTLARALPECEPDAIYLGMEAWAKIHGMVSLELSGHLSAFIGRSLDDLSRSMTDGYLSQFEPDSR